MTNPLQEQLQASLGAAYSIERELAAGGMSRVFLAREEALGRKVVIKVLPPELGSSVSIERFKREISLAARLQHAHIVPLHFAGESDGLPFFTMPYIEGDSLRTRLARDGALPLNDAIRMLREIASALSYAHEHGVVHRDIKPDNVLLSGDATMVSDFGVAKAIVRSTIGRRGQDTVRDDAASPGGLVTSLGVALGTPAYMAPEQVTGDPGVDHRADIYAFGSLAYEVFAGQPPFAGRTSHLLLAAQISERPEAIQNRRHDLPPALAALIMQCLEKRQEDRPPSAARIVDALDDIAGITSGQTTSASTVFAVRGNAWTRNWAVVAVLAIVAVLGAAIVARVLRGGAPTQPLLAILPFQNLGQPDEEYFADGLTEEISSRLAGISGLGIIGRASSAEYKGTAKSLRQIAEDLHVQYVLTGTVRWEREGSGRSRVRVSPHLIRASDQTSAWAKSYEGALSDVFSFQAMVAEGVAQALNVTLPAQERTSVAAVPTQKLDAYDAYLRGLSLSTRSHLFEPRSRNEAIAEFLRATDLDPSFTAAHARLALAYVNAERYGNDRGALVEAATHLKAAISLDSAAVETRMADAWLSLERNDLSHAQAVVQTLIRDGAASGQALYLGGLVEEALDHPDEAITRYLAAERLEPMSSDPPAALAALYDALGRHGDATRTRERELVLAPDNASAYYAQAASHLLQSYDSAAARRVLERGMASAGLQRMMQLPRSWILDWVGVMPLSLRAGLDTLSRAGAAQVLPGLLFDETKFRFHLFGGAKGVARAYADSVLRGITPRHMTSQPELILLLAAAYATLGRMEDAHRASDSSYALGSGLSGGSRKIPIMLTATWVDQASGRSDVAIQRLEETVRLRAGFYVSPALLRSDRMWASLRTHPRFSSVVTLVR